MAQHDPSRTESATPKRRNKARGEGSVPKSQELPKPLTLLFGLLMLQIYLGTIRTEIENLMHWFFTEGFTFELTPASTYTLFLDCLYSIAIMVMPLMLVIALAAFVVVRLQVGKLWAPKVFKPKFKNFNVVSGLKKLLISKQTIVRLLKSVFMAAAVALGPYIVLKQAFGEVIPLFYQTAESIAAYVLSAGQTMFYYALAPMILIGLADLLYTRWDYEENLKMTKSEVKDERKQAEGDPMIKNKQRQKMMAVMMRRMMQDVPKADVVITNPTHLAIAIRYNSLEAPAPLVLAKGAGEVAQRIKDIARENNVPIRENKPLARALYKVVEVGDTIPEEFYQAVAAILAQVYKTKQRPR
ncbi:MAG: flagellar biosynthesis protein FlhB [Desulfomicrobium sp.]|nr:flagellar biosynthesis protein FlhB [Pseudomonadota bacterium]MBV1712422.1 flagellar biosynthesis protein FlhB [Desulfomicrobium sp.]MBU4571134.1 flagellar biosynthesis protein FlhB [Pseudomonadota bacterium]MBU4592871.1 flagellar biosynthesis protein FlhB [Pseudomonadota bacterium]MBV1720493.1 flagellar biosynthesis protein FlhB [Desulfomicrobium sp.]